MKTLLMIASFVEGLSSQVDVSSESSAMMLLNSEKNLLSSSKLLSLEGTDFVDLRFSVLKLFMKRFD